MNIGEAVDELSASRIAEECESIESLAIALADFAHHLQQHPVVPDIALDQTLKTIAIAVAAYAYGEKRAQDDAAVPAAERSERITVLRELPPRSVHHDDEFDIVAWRQNFMRHIEHVWEARIVATSVNCGRAHVVKRLCFLMARTGQLPGNISHLFFLRDELGRPAACRAREQRQFTSLRAAARRAGCSG